MPPAGQWITRGFEQFRQGTFADAGRNLYVSRAGVLQRIHQYDLDRDGYLDLMLCNSQDHCEQAPAYVYTAPLGQSAPIALPADGARGGIVADLNGDGCDELVLANFYGGMAAEVNAAIYYGGPGGWSERRTQQLPAPQSQSAAAGDFNGDGRSDLAFITQGKVRLFYQSALGFEPHRYVDTAIEGGEIGADDLDGDGFAELIVREKNGRMKIFWGGPDGIDPGRFVEIPVPPDPPVPANQIDPEMVKYEEYVEDASPLVKTLDLPSGKHVFVARSETVHLVAVRPDRAFRPVISFDCRRALSVTAGDFDGDGRLDLAFACREPGESGERSWVFWGEADGWNDQRRTALKSLRACDAAAGDLDGAGRDQLVLCQCNDGERFTTESLVYRTDRHRQFAEPQALTSHDARRVFVAKPDPDGRPAVVLVNHFSRNVLGNTPISIFAGGPDGFDPKRVRQLPGWGAVEAVCCDLNDDGRADLIVANCSENSVHRDPGSYIYYQGPEGFGSEPSVKLRTARAHGVACADLDRDGYLDLVFCGFNNDELLIFRGTAEGIDTRDPARIRLEYDGVAYTQPRWIHLVDLNNDGWLDLVVPMIEHDRSLILWGAPEGFSMARCQALSVIRAASAAAADFTGNGYPDLILGGHMRSPQGPHDSFVHIYWNGPDGLREDRRMLLPANAVNSMAVADFNRDGTLDLFVGSYADHRVRDLDSYIYWNRPGRLFSESDRTRLFTHSVAGCLAADFNDDGWIDLAVANHKVWGDHTGYSEIWWNGPDGFSSKRTTRLPSRGPHGISQIGPGNVLDRGPDEYYISKPFKLPEGATLRQVNWQAELLPRTYVRAQLRWASSEKQLVQSPWCGPNGPNGWFANGQTVPSPLHRGQWVQYRLALGSANSGGSPRLTQVALDYDGQG